MFQPINGINNAYLSSSFNFSLVMSEETVVKYYFLQNQENAPHYNSPPSTTEIDLNLPKISFLSLNSLLQRHFYNICSPNLCRNLFLCSRNMKEIKCPIYITHITWIYNLNYGPWKTAGINPKL